MESTFEIKALLEIIRPLNCIFGGLTPIIAVLTTNQFYNIGLPLDQLLLLSSLGFFIYILVAGAGNVVNDIYDIEIDKVNRPNRVLPRGAMSINQAKYYTIFLASLGTILAYIISPASAIVVIAFIGVGILYAAKAKVAGVIGNFAVAISFSFGLIFGGFYTSPNGIIAPVIWFYFITSATLLAAREIIKGMEDVAGDELRDVKTIARKYGLKTAAMVAMILNIVGILFFTGAWAFNWVGQFYIYLMVPADIAVIASIIYLLRDYKNSTNQEYASRSDKIGAFLGLLCFLIGVI